ncbi:MAG: peptidase domain-containing ABC transporter [Muribaculaceae bacterium]|nr:peptidase domain-containing ABC transporter [Muribaculaceae bacterium]
MYKIKAFRQLEHSDCGITCIRIIAYFYGVDIPLKFLRSICDISRVGISIRDILSATKKIGFEANAVKVSAEDILKMPLPAILYWENKHYIVLYKIKNNKFYIADPGRGKLILDNEEFLNSWLYGNSMGLAIVLAPKEEFYNIDFGIKDSSESGLFKLAKKSISKHLKRFIAVIVLSIVVMLADMITPLIFQSTIDEGIEGKDINLVWVLCLSQFLIFIGYSLSDNVINIILTKTGLKVSIDMMNEYLSKLISFPISFFDRKVNSDFIQKIEDQNRIKNFLIDFPSSAFLTGINIVVFSAMLIYYNYIIFLILLAATFLGFLWTKTFLQKRENIDYSYFYYSSNNRNNIYELINGMQEIKINNAHNIRIAKWKETQLKINELSFKTVLLKMLVNGGNSVLSRIKDIIITGACATLVIKGNMSVGEMMTISYITGRLSSPFSYILNSLNTMQDATMSYERIDEIINKPLDNKSKYKEHDNIQSIIFSNVSFKYPGSYSPYVLKDINITIPQGKVTAIVGCSGSGKSTLLKLMLGFYIPQKGDIYAGKYNMSDIDTDNWISRCGVVMQNGFIFSGTILENIALSDSKPDINRVKYVTNLACINEFIDTLPMGYHTKIGVTGVELSGGQKQRILIARAVYKNPSFIFLDEATNALDAKNERVIVENLNEFYKGRTVVIVAHRLSTVKNADNIIVLEGGRVAETGNHESLIAQRGAYFNLVRNQLELGN